MKIKFECPRCVTRFEKEERIITRHTFLDKSSSYVVRCPSCFFVFEISKTEVEQQIKTNLDKLSKGGH